MLAKTLGRLEPVDPREVWTSESGNFTPWLSQSDNLILLGEAIGLELELQGTEQSVGPFRADILCKDTVTETLVLIENQLERTDHSHLGQLLTYAAGLNAVTIVWIARQFTDEHRAALNWLNGVTNESVNLFGLEVELWRIGDSAIAPKFNVISKPNNWVKTISAIRQSDGSLTPVEQLRFEYWQSFVGYLEEQHSFLKAREPKPTTALTFPIGRSGFRLWALVYPVYGENISVQLGINRGKADFNALYQQKAAIEAEIGSTLEWGENPSARRRTVTLNNKTANPNNRAQWREQFDWLKNTLEAFHRAFARRIRALSTPDLATDFAEE